MNYDGIFYKVFEMLNVTVVSLSCYLTVMQNTVLPMWNLVVNV